MRLGAVDRAEPVTTSKEEEMTTREEPDCVPGDRRSVCIGTEARI